MEITEQQLVEFRKQFAARRGRQKFVAVPLVLLLLVLYFASDKDAGTVFGQSLIVVAPVFAAVLLGTALFSWRNWRCPACDRYLGRSAGQKVCGKCGVVLEE
jgi:hypothetical protein